MSMFDIVYRLSRKIPGFSRVLRIVYGCDIPRKAQIGKNVVFGHKALGVVIHKDVIIEDNVMIQHHVCVGMNKIGEPTPIIREGAFLGPYSMVLGNVEIGKNAVVGAGTIVMEDLDANGIYISKVNVKKIGCNKAEGKE